MIEVRELTKRYGHVLAVASVSFDVAAGEVVGLLGPNGAGKSTTMKMLTCYLPPTSGTAKVAGFDIFHQGDDVRRNLGYLPENCPLYPEMKVTEYLEFRGRLRRMSREDRRRRIAEVLEKCWLSNVQSRAIGHLSKGYRQRVGLADALLHDPKVLILDEPTVGLDPTQIRETRKLIKDLGGRHTVMLSTHILPEVEAVCSRAVVIAGGNVVAQGSLEELRRGTGSRGGGGGGAGGGGRVVVELKADATQARPVLAAVGGVRQVELTARDGAYCRFAVEARDGADVREAVAAAVVSQGWALREVKIEAESLEEFFVRVTAQQAVGTAPQALDESASQQGGAQ